MDETPTKENSIQNGGFMHHKNIKNIIRKQLKKQYPNWNRTDEELGMLPYQTSNEVSEIE
jgi:hypothetical protein